MGTPVIIETARTPIGRAYKGSLVDVRADDLGGQAVAGLLDRVRGLEPAEVEDVIVGCGLTHHEQGFNVGRIVSLLGGLPATVPGTTVNRFCASSLQTIRMASHAIWAGEGSTFIAAGIESVTRCYGKGFDSEDINPRFADESRPDFINLVYIPMGETAENVASKYGISRERMDAFAKRSQDRAVEAQKNGFFDREIVPVTVPDGRVMSQDDGPRPNTTLEKLASLEPAFRPGGSVTAGNSCPLNDGAAAVLVMDEARANALGLKPRARVLASSVSGIAPEYMGVGPIEAINRVLERTGMKIDDVDLIELNEAFAAQVLAVVDSVGIDEERLNVHGGAIALGHPFGMTGARIMGTLLNGLESLDKSIGLETMCVGGGQGMAMLVERI
jgi:acetyl-CoA C-acetyltransferase